jgi:hypothetical protein
MAPLPDFLSTPNESANDSLINLVLLETTATKKTSSTTTGDFIQKCNVMNTEVV